MAGVQGMHFFAVSDGHGMNGHHVSAYIKEKLPRKIIYFIKLIDQILELIKKENKNSETYHTSKNKEAFH